MASDNVAIGGFQFEQRHGKSRVRVARVWRDASGHHYFVEWSVNISLLSDCLPAYTSGDNSDIVATDTMKNTVYVKAKECNDQISAEEFAIFLAKHFTSYYKQVTAAIVNIVEKPWERVFIDGEPHKHGFKLGSEKHTTEVIVKKSGELQITSGIEGLSVLKTTQSGFEGFIRDKYTVLPETRERMLATEVSASWRYPYASLSGIPSKPSYFAERYLDIKQSLVETFFGSPKEGVYSPSISSCLVSCPDLPSRHDDIYQKNKNTALASFSTAMMGVLIICLLMIGLIERASCFLRFPDVASIKLNMPNIHFLPVNLSSKDTQIVKFNDDVYMPTDEPHGSIEASLSRIQSKI
ncbi:unnamed protein product [Rhodiola kirilowii]